ncbi:MULTISPECIES: CDP-alcohol phosphatidyltransferase family protein [Dyella]|nr:MULTISPECIES: CDP-alcohol phosphatidyltransferase family protein [Dyella]
MSRWRHLPNVISCLRIALTGPACWAILTQRPGWALAIIAVAGASDGLDGFLARHFGWQSRLGGLLDAIADKLLLVTCFLAMAEVGWCTWWLALLVCGRDLVIAMGAFAWRTWIGPVQPEPSLLSKANTLMQIVYLLAALLVAWRHEDVLLPWLSGTVAVLTAASGLDYVTRWSWRARGVRRQARSR